MQYMLLIYTPVDATPEPAETAAWMSYTQQLQESGAMVAGDGLQGLETATTVRVRDGESLVTDGPFAETKEMLGGYYLVDLPSHEAAILPRVAPLGRRFGVHHDVAHALHLALQGVDRVVLGREEHDARALAA